MPRLSSMDSSRYPVHGYGRPVRLTNPIGNAFAENREFRRRSGLTAYQHRMAISRNEAAEQRHAARYRTAADDRADSHANADSPRAFARPVSSWSFVNNNNNRNNNNNYQGTLDISRLHESLLTIDPLPQTLADFFPEELRYLADIPEDQLPQSTPDYSIYFPEFAAISHHLEVTRRQREAAIMASMSPSDERERSLRELDHAHEKAQAALRRLGYKPNTHAGPETNQQALVPHGNTSHESNVSGRNNRGEASRHGLQSVESDVADGIGPGTQGPLSRSKISGPSDRMRAQLQGSDMVESNSSDLTVLNIQTPPRLDSKIPRSKISLHSYQSPESKKSPLSRTPTQSNALPLSKNPAQSTKSPLSKNPAQSDTSPQSTTSRRTNRDTSTPLQFDEYPAKFPTSNIQNNQPVFPALDAPSASFASRYVYRSQSASGGDDMLLVDRDMNDIHPIVRKRIGPPLPPVPRYDKETDTFIPPQRVDSIQPRPDSAASSVVAPRRTPPARFAALTTQQTAPMPVHLSKTYPIKKIAKNDAMVMCSGPLLPTRDGNYAATGLPRTVDGRQINSVMAQLDCSSPVTAAPTVLSPVAPVFSPSGTVFKPFQDQNTLDMLIKRVDRLEMKAEADRRVIGELKGEVGGLRKEVEGLKGGRGQVEVEREIGDGWYTSN